jgi:hypothetical protein
MRASYTPDDDVRDLRRITASETDPVGITALAAA